MSADRIGTAWPSESSSGTGERYDEVSKPMRANAEDTWSLVTDPESESETKTHPPRSWAHFSIKEEVGSGTFGEVYRAWDEKLEREVALKLLKPASNRTHDYRQEARLLARVRHPNVVTVYGADWADGQFGIWMEFVRGVTLDRILGTSGTFGEKEAGALVQDLCSAIAALHQKRIIHRDIKTRNIMREHGGRIILMDFGLGSDLAQSNSGALQVIAGTRQYMAPELFEKEPADVRTDVYALGIVLFNLVSNAYPVEGRNIPEVHREHLMEHYKSLRDLRPSLSKEFLRIAERACSPDPRYRYATAGKFAEDMERYLRRGSTRREIAKYSFGGLVALGLGKVGYDTALPIFFPPPDPLPIIVADFVPTSDPELARFLRSSLIIALQQHQGFHVLNRQAIKEVLGLMQVPESAVLTPELAVQVARREGIRFVVTGELRKASDGNEFLVRTYDASEGTDRRQTIHLLRERKQVLQIADEETLAIKEELGRTVGLRSEPPQPLERVTTPSLEALEEFTKAKSDHANGSTELPLSHLRSALKHDPEFAMAHRQLAAVYSRLGRHEEALKSATSAYKLRDRTSERERFLIDGLYFTRRNDYMRALESFREFSLRFQSDAVGLYQLAQLESYMAGFSAGVDRISKAVELRPNNAEFRALLVLLQVYAGQYDEALNTYTEATAKNMSLSHLSFTGGLAFLCKGQTEKARELFSEMKKGGGSAESTGLLYQAQSLILDGRLDQAMNELEGQAATHHKTQHGRYGRMARFWLSRLYLLQGDSDNVSRHLSSLNLETAGLGEVRDIRVAGLIAAEAGLQSYTAVLASQVRTLADRYPSNFMESTALQLEGLVQQLGGKPSAEFLLDSARQKFADHLPIWSLAEWYRTHERWEEAAPLYDQVVRRKGVILADNFGGMWVLALLHAARCHSRLGAKEIAATYYSQFLLTWEDATTFFPDVALAKDELARI